MPQLAKYELLEELGHGGMATVYRARDRRLGREVAVKVIHPHLRDSREVVSRFNAEAKAVAKLRHPNIVDVYDVSEPDEPDQYLVVGLVRGTTLRKLLQERGPMPPEIGAALGSELLAALAHAHANGVVHRDVKPENVLIERSPVQPEVGADATVHERDEARVLVKLTDFGIAKLLDAQGVTSTGQVLGSPAHMSPEQIEGGDVDARSDVFGVGVLLYECVVGHLPFDGNNPAQVLRRVLDGTYPEAQHERPIVGSRWSKLLDRALSHAPVDRFADASEMRDAIAAELRRLDIESPERDLEAWLDDPAGFEDLHRKTLIARLCALASDARKMGDVLAAAADYNRALAYAPSDPHLLRIVAGMNRAERRGRVLRRVGGASAVALGLCALVLGAEAFLRGRVVPPASARPSASVDPALPAATSAPPSALASIAPSSVAPPVPTPAATPHDPVQRVNDRRLTLDLKPPMGVSLSIDGQPDRGVSTGDVLTLGTKAHVLGFSCPVCTPVRVTVDASERDTRLSVYVPVKPATLVVDGDGARTYQIIEHPEIIVRAGSNTVPLRSEYEPVTVKQIETGDSVSVRLEAAKTMHAAFP
jgi:eukaryotic-like serine/threonine-protein kinase